MGTRSNPGLRTVAGSSGAPAPSTAQGGNPFGADADYSTRPYLVIWEMTRSCDLACLHCRAEAVTRADPLELKTIEAEGMLARIREEFGPIVVVLTGGDPAKRSDLVHLISHGSRLGLTMALTPSVTPLVTEDLLERCFQAGLRRIAFSLDGSDAVIHDGFRGVPGTFERTRRLLDHSRTLGLETQINSSIGRHNRHQLSSLAAMAQGFGIRLWSVFLLVPTGRADQSMLLSPAEHELVYRELADIALDLQTRFVIKTTAGQPYYRVLSQAIARRSRGPAAGAPTRPIHAGRGVNDGNGICFVSHTGTISPSGFLPIACGNIRRDDLIDIYRNHPLFQALRAPDRFGGKCGSCEFRSRCGGSRSRAFGLTGDPLAADPTCVYTPRPQRSDSIAN